MTRRDWWLGIALLTVALLLHATIPACVPRYEYIVLGPQSTDVIRHDRWTGRNDHMCIIDRGPDSLTAPLPLR